MTAPDPISDPAPDPIQVATEAASAALMSPPPLAEAIDTLNQAEDREDRRSLIETLIHQLARHASPATRQNYREAIVTDHKWIKAGDWAEMARAADREVRDAQKAEGRAGRTAAVAERREADPRHWLKGCDADPDSRMPEDYECDSKGVVYIGGEWPMRITSGPLLVAEVYADPDGDQAVTLAWRDGYRWVYRTVPRSVAKSGRRLVAELGDAAFPAVEADSKAVERYLARYETENAERIPRRELARYLGWQPDGTFVAANGDPRVIEPKYREQVPYIAAHRPYGTLDGWKDAVAHAADYPVVKSIVAAGLASSLLRPLGLPSSVVDVAGRSTRGKTTTAQAGLSVWADPSQTGDGMFAWKTTMLALEKRLNSVRGLFVALDETRLIAAAQPEFIAEAVFQIAAGKGKPRDGGWPSNLPWEVIVCSTGEQPCLSFGTDQGAAARVLTVTRPPFGTDGEKSAAAAIAVRDGVAANYGVAGPAFVATLCDLLADKVKAKELRDRHEQLRVALRGPTDMSSRRAPVLAALALAGELGREWDILPWDPPTTDEWLSMFGAPDQAEDRGAAALDIVRQFVAANRPAFWTLPPRPTKPDEEGFERFPPSNGGWAGRIFLELINQKTGEVTPEMVAILPQRLKEVLAKAEYELDAVIPSWLEAGIVYETPSQRPRWQAVRQLDKVKVRMVIFRPENFRLDDDSAGGNGE